MSSPPLVAADDWRRQTWRRLSDIPTPAPNTWVHHGGDGAVNTPTLPVLRGYERYHVVSQGWRALGYSFAYGEPFVGGWATVYEGRGWGRAGAHTGGQNRVSHGHLLIGGWSTGEVPIEMIRSLAWNVADGHRRGLCELSVDGGHRDAPGAWTSCPGAAGMGAVRSARRLIDEILHDEGDWWDMATDEEINARIDERIAEAFGLGDASDGSYVRDSHRQWRDYGIHSHRAVVELAGSPDADTQEDPEAFAQRVADGVRARG